MTEEKSHKPGLPQQGRASAQSADSRVDAVAAVGLILLLVIAAVFWVSNQ